MNFEQWLAANGYDAAALSTSQRKHLESAWRAECNPPPVAPVVPTGASSPAAPPAAPPSPNSENPYEVALAEARMESDRRATIDKLIAEQIRSEVGFPERVNRLDLIRKAAIDGKWDVQKTQFELLKEARRLTGNITSIAGRERETSAEVIEAAVLRGVGYTGIEKKFNEQTLSAVDRHYRRGMTLVELIKLAAEQRGYRGSYRDTSSMCRHAFSNSDNFAPRADAGPSTIDVTGILSNVANKFLETAFLYTEQSWRAISRIRPANDYKEMSIFRMTGSAKFEKISPGGEVKHGTLGELSYGLKADVYGKMLGISEQDIRNDDLGAFSGAADELGRGAGDSLNDIFWTEWLDDSSFFSTGNSNYDDGTDTVLGVSGLDHVETLFRLQTKPDGTPLGAMPRILLVPAALYNTALQLMGSQGLVVGTTPASGPQQNVFFGRYQTVSSVFLDARATVGSTSWYLLADPNNIPGIAVCFLDNVQTPTVESGSFDFDRLGLAMRGTMRFGVRKQEYRCGVRVKGAA